MNEESLWFNHLLLNFTFCFQTITEEEYQWVLNFITTGAQSLQAYDEYKKIGLDKAGKFRVMNKGIAMRHRMSMGTIVGESAMKIKYVSSWTMIVVLETIEIWIQLLSVH